MAMAVIVPVAMIVPITVMMVAVIVGMVMAVTMIVAVRRAHGARLNVSADEREFACGGPSGRAAPARTTQLILAGGLSGGERDAPI